MSGNKQITKVIVYYSDGTSEEIVKMPVERKLRYPSDNPWIDSSIDDSDVIWRAWGAGREDPGQ